MDLVRHLTYFAAIANEEHFGRAAQRLGIRQPPLSQGLRRLEDDLGVKLFDRTSRTVRLSSAGQALLPAALRVLDEVEQLRMLANRHRGPLRARIRVRVAPGLGAGHYATVVAACRQAVPEADVDVSEQATAGQLADLRANRADVGVLREPVVARDLDLGRPVTVALNAMLPADHPAATAGSASLRQLSGHGLVMLPRQQAPAAHDELLALCERHGFLPDSVHETPDDRVARGLVVAGGLVGLTTDPPGRDAGLNVVALAGTPLTVQFRICRGKALPAPAEPILDVLRSALAVDAEPDRSPGVPRPATGLPATTRLPPAAA